MHLHTEAVEAASARATQTVLFIHGILGQGANLKTLAKRLVQARPEFRVLLVDLRAHGQSLELDGDDTLSTAADDIVSLANEQIMTVSSLVGHSFGGKVALRASTAMPALKDVVMIDSNPGRRISAQGSEGTIRVLELLEQQVGPWPSRAAFVDAFHGLGQDRAVGNWLAMQLAREGDRFRFGLDLNRIRSLLKSYFEEDLWPLIDQATSPVVHLLIANRSAVFSAEDVLRAEQAAKTHSVRVERMDAGHWVHVDAFEPLLASLVSRLR